MRGFGLNLISLGLVLAASACIVEVDGGDEGLGQPAASLLEGSSAWHETAVGPEPSDEVESLSESPPPGSVELFRFFGIVIYPTPDPWNDGYWPGDGHAGPTPDPWNPEQAKEGSGSGRGGATTPSNGSKN